MLVNNICLVGAFVCYILVGTINLLAYGNNVYEIVLMNLPYNNWLDYFSKIGYCFSILISYPLNIYPCYSIVENLFADIKIPKLVMDFEEEDNHIINNIYKKYGIRLSLMATLYMIAYFIPKFS
jgi:proton-coupled amino acid transporter